MIPENINKVVDAMARSARSLDVGGWHRPIRSATHVLDINPYDTRMASMSFDPERVQRYSSDTWFVSDICNHDRWPFPDKYFDFAVCSHVLEDIRDPIWVVSEMARVARAGYIECPSADYELLGWVTFWQYLTSTSGCVGALHHRWLVDIVDEHSIVFRMKPYDLVREGRYVPVTRLHSVQYSGQAKGVFWDGGIEAREEIFDIRDWIDGRLRHAESLVRFDPIGRIRERLQRRGHFTANSVDQPPDESGVKYPYL